MNKEQYMTTLQACLFALDGSTEQEVMFLNPDYNKLCIRVGFELAKYLKNLQLKSKEVSNG